MSDNESIIKASPADIAKRLMSIKKECGLSYLKFTRKLNTNNLGYKIAITPLQSMVNGTKEVSAKLLVPLAAVLGYNPQWVLLGNGDKKITKEISKIITDIQVYRIELDILQAKLKAAEVRMNSQDNRIAYLERELNERV